MSIAVLSTIHKAEVESSSMIYSTNFRLLTQKSAKKRSKNAATIDTLTALIKILVRDNETIVATPSKGHIITLQVDATEANMICQHVTR